MFILNLGKRNYYRKILFNENRTFVFLTKSVLCSLILKNIQTNSNFESIIELHSNFAFKNTTAKKLKVIGIERSRCIIK